MKKLKYLGVAAVIGLLIGVAISWATSEAKNRKDPLNQSEAFMYSDNGILYLFELTSRNGKVKGNLQQLKIIEESGKEASIEEKKYSLTGETLESGYAFNVKNGGEMMKLDAWFSEKNLAVQKLGENDVKLYKAVDHEELDKYVNAIQQELETIIYHAEEKEKKRIRKFFSELDSVYGYLYSSVNGKFQLFIKIDESTLQGDVTGSLLMMSDTGNKHNPYEEIKYVLNGITDGHMVMFFTTVDGKETKLKGNFHEAATDFDLSFWTTDQKLSFHAVTEKEFKHRYEEFKKKAEK